MPKPQSGKFKPKNPEKYAGNVQDIVFRSGMERRFMSFCDNNPNILRWSSEEIIIPYYSPIDKKQHRYFPDMCLVIKNKQGEVEKVLVEIKPLKQCSQPDPKLKEKHPRIFLRECKNWEVNQAKWAAAKEFCDKNNMKFVILTDKHLSPPGYLKKKNLK